jgi:hypothetical protein
MLNPTARDRYEIQNEYRTTTKHKEKKEINRKSTNHLRLYKIRRKFPKISVYLLIALTVEAHPAEGQQREKQLNTENLVMFRAGKPIPTVSITGGKHSVPL